MSECENGSWNCEFVKLWSVKFFWPIKKRHAPNFEIRNARHCPSRFADASISDHVRWASSDSGSIKSILIFLMANSTLLFSLWNSVDKDCCRLTWTLWQKVCLFSCCHIQTGIIIMMFSQESRYRKNNWCLGRIFVHHVDYAFRQTFNFDIRLQNDNSLSIWATKVRSDHSDMFTNIQLFCFSS